MFRSLIGTLKWIEKLKWNRLPDFLKAPRKPLYPPSGVRSKETGAFVQNFDNLYFYWILKAGHMVRQYNNNYLLSHILIHH